MSVLAEISETLRAEINRYNSVLERLRVVSLNRQQLQAELLEVEEALKELEKVSEDRVYKVVGRIVVSRSKDEIVKELSERKETLTIRVQSLQKQESLLRKQLEELEKKLRRKLGGQVGGAATS